MTKATELIVVVLICGAAYAWQRPEPYAAIDAVKAFVVSTARGDRAWHVTAAGGQHVYCGRFDGIERHTGLVRIRFSASMGRFRLDQLSAADQQWIQERTNETARREHP